MARSRYFKDAVIILSLAAAYFAGGELGLHFAGANATATALWPGAGIALAGLLLFGWRVWPGVLLGAFLASLTTPDSWVTALGVATGSSLEALAGCYLINRFAGGKQVFERAQDIFKFALIAGLLSPAISATIGVSSTLFGGLMAHTSFASVWATWLLGDAAGAIIVTPLILLWAENPRLRPDGKS